MEFSLEVRKMEGVSVLDLNGRLCVGSALLSLRNAVKQSLAEGTNKLVLNLDAVTFIDSSGLGELITTHSAVQNGQGAMNILKASTRVKALFQATGLDRVFELFEDEAASIQKLRG